MAWLAGRPGEYTVARGSAGIAPDTIHLVHQPGAVQSLIAVARVWRDRQDESYVATRIGNRILGGDFLSRLNQNLRQHKDSPTACVRDSTTIGRGATGISSRPCEVK